MNEAREGMHSGPMHDTREKRTPSAASESIEGVRTLSSPAQPIMSARCWSDMTSTMLGLPLVTAVPPRAHTPAAGGPDLGTARVAPVRGCGPVAERLPGKGLGAVAPVRQGRRYPRPPSVDMECRVCPLI